MATIQVAVPMLGALADVRDRFFALCLEAGRQVLTAMMEQDRTDACWTEMEAESYTTGETRWLGPEPNHAG
jgi:hypothetical protein